MSTPDPHPLPPGECHVWWAVADGSENGLLGLLDATEHQRQNTLRHAPSRAVYVLAHAVVRAVCAGLVGTTPATVPLTATCRQCGGPHGRTQLSTEDGPVWISLSHSGNRAAVALAREVPVGVDVEQVSLRGESPPTLALARSEQDALAALPAAEQTRGFITYWTRKEAVLKCTGDGLYVAPDTVVVSEPDTVPRLVSWTDRPPPELPIHLATLDPGEGYLAAVAMLGRPLRVVERSAAALLAAHRGT